MIKIGVIGCGYWGPNLVRNFNQLEGVLVDYICDMDESKLAKIKKTYPNAKTSRDYLDVIKDPEINAICIATPLETHYQLAKEGLLNNKNVLIEKPFTKNSPQAQELIEIARKNNLVLMVDHTFVYTGAVRKIKELIDKGELGKLYYFDSERINLGLIRSDANVIWDLATHDISIIDYLLKQKPINVSVIGSSHISNSKEEMAHIILRHEDGIMSHIHVSWLSPVKIRKILVAGSKKMVLYNDIEQAEKIRIYDKGIDIKTAEVTPFTPLYREGDIIIPKIDQTEALKKVAEEFVACIKGKKKPLTDGSAGLRVVKILEAIQKSLESKGQLVEIE
ncbi:MAG: Gfo/Idh/MocA family oxidoreductase [Candidatus Portnoybacteria bacterium]